MDSGVCIVRRFTDGLDPNFGTSCGSANRTMAGDDLECDNVRTNSGDLRLGFRLDRADCGVSNSGCGANSSCCRGGNCGGVVDSLGGGVDGSGDDIEDEDEAESSYSKLRFDSDEAGLDESLVLL